MNLYDKILSYKDSNLPAIVEGSDVISYKDLIEKSLSIAVQLPNNESVIGLNFKKGSEYIVNLLAVFFSKDSFVILNQENPIDRNNFIKTKSKVSFELPLCSSGLTKNNLSKDKDIEYSFFTSGSTGTPKGIQITRKAFFNTIEQQIKIFKYNQSKMYLFVSIGFDASLSDIFCALGSESTIYIDDSLKKNPNRLKDFLIKEKITHLDIAPSYLKLINPNKEFSLKSIIVGGESPAVSMFRKWSEMSSIFNVYGPTECAICTSIEEYQGQDNLSLGNPLKNIEYKIKDSELYIHSPFQTLQYIDNDLPESFVKLDEKLYFKTGDLIDFKDGLVFFKGRVDNQIKKHGQLVNLEEIEKVLMKHPLVLNCMAIYCDEKISLIYEGIVDKDIVSSFLSKSLNSYMLPSYIFKYKILKNSNGKNDRKKMLPHLSDFLIEKSKIKFNQTDINLPIGKEILITGSNGLLGQKLLQSIDRSKNIYCLVRKEPKIRFDGVTYLKGDLSKENFGLNDSEYESLKKNIGVIFNLAAEVNNLKGFDDLYLSNVESAINILKFSYYGLKKIHHVSTLSTEVSHLERSKEIPEDVLKRNGRFYYSGYAQSKFLSELLMYDYPNSIIYRPGLIISEELPRFFNKTILKLNEIKEIPMGSDSFKMDLTPIEVIVDCLLSNKEKTKVLNCSINESLTVKEIVPESIEVSDFYKKYEKDLIYRLIPNENKTEDLNYNIFETTGVNKYNNKNFLSSLTKPITFNKKDFLSKIKDIK